MRKLKKINVVIAIVPILAVLSVIAYLAADRYLIKHVEMENVNPPTSEAVLPNDEPENGESDGSDTTGLQNGSNNTGDRSIETDAKNEGETADETAGGNGVQSDGKNTAYTLDNWNYASASSSIAVHQVVTGSGNDRVTYFVAEVALSEASNLSSAFAGNKFGRNIIENTSDIAESQNAVFAVNGDYYGFRSDGIVIRNGVIYRNKPARTGLAIYRDGSMKIYDETETDAEVLLDEGVWNTMSFGPTLLQDSVVPENLTEIEIDTNFGNHSIQGNHPRTGVGFIDKDHFVFVVVDGRSRGYSKGVTLPEFAEIFRELGCTDAYNLDGGGSSTMYFNGRVVNNPQGKNKERGVSDIFYIAYGE